MTNATCFKTKTVLATVISLALMTTAQADDQTLDFGVPAWPGITVKTAIAEQLLSPLGYEIGRASCRERVYSRV